MLPRSASLRRTRWAAFTVIELVLAMSLSAVLIVGALATFSLLITSERRLAQRLDDSADLVVAQTIIRRAMGSLIAARPEEPARAGTGESAAESPSDRERAADELAGLITSVIGDERLAHELTRGLGADGPMFDLYFEPLDSLYLPTLAVKVMESPVPPPPDTLDTLHELGVDQFLPVRGVFETLRVGDGLAIQWRPIAPPGPPTLILRDLAAVEWYALPHNGEWTDVYAAFLQESFPAAVRLVVWTNKGTHVDWLFDVAATTVQSP